MVLASPTAIAFLAEKTLFPAWHAERTRLDQIRLWYTSTMEDVRVPRDASPELKYLIDLAKTPWLGLVVTTCAQAMSVDGYRAPSEKANTTDGPWGTWLENDMDARQHALHRAMLAYGTAYTTILPGTPRAVIRPVSPRQMLAFYQDPTEDVWPDYAIRVRPSGKQWRVNVMDEEAIYHLICDADGSNMTYVSADEHNVGYCPVVRYTNLQDLDGDSPGEVEPFIGVAKRINKSTYDRLLAQHFTSWTVRTIAGLAAPDDEDEARRQKIKLRQDDLLVAEDPDTKFGTLPGTPLDGFIAAWRSDIEALVAVSQTPATSLLGSVNNVNAEALASIRGPFTQKVWERKTYAGKSHRQTLRCAADIEGNQAAADDLESRVTWQDLEIRSMGQAVDALGKAAQMLMIPAEALWAMIPGVTKADVDDWKAMRETQDPMRRLGRELADEEGVPAGTTLPDAPA